GLIVHDRGRDFLNAVALLRDDTALRERLGAAARATVAARYSINICAASWLDFLSDHARAPNASLRYRRPRVPPLPPHNPKLGYFDRRPPGLLKRLHSRLTRICANR